MHKHLEHRNTTHVDVFYLLWSDVLSLGQLEDVLLPVDDAQCPILRGVDGNIYLTICTFFKYLYTSNNFFGNS